MGLPRRQELPDSALWTCKELKDFRAMPSKDHGRRVDGDGSNCPIIAVSYCWVTPDHPDPDGEQLKLLVRMLKGFHSYYKQIKDTAIFLDWCSLYQKSFGDALEEASFRSALQNVNIWYMHTITNVWCLTEIPKHAPKDMKSYHERGWP